MSKPYRNGYKLPTTSIAGAIELELVGVTASGQITNPYDPSMEPMFLVSWHSPSSCGLIATDGRNWWPLRPDMLQTPARLYLSAPYYPCEAYAVPSHTTIQLAISKMLNAE